MVPNRGGLPRQWRAARQFWPMLAKNTKKTYVSLYGRWEALHICKRCCWGVGVFSAIERSILRTFKDLLVGAPQTFFWGNGTNYDECYRIYSEPMVANLPWKGYPALLNAIWEIALIV